MSIGVFGWYGATIGASAAMTQNATIAPRAIRAPRLARKRRSAIRHGPSECVAGAGGRSSGVTSSAISAAAAIQAIQVPRSSATSQSRIDGGGEQVREQAADDDHSAA